MSLSCPMDSLVFTDPSRSSQTRAAERFASLPFSPVTDAIHGTRRRQRTQRVDKDARPKGDDDCSCTDAANPSVTFSTVNDVMRFPDRMSNDHPVGVSQH